MVRKKRRVTRAHAHANSVPTSSILGLPESLLTALLSKVSLLSRGFSHALVCRAWAQASVLAQATFRTATRTWTPTGDEVAQEMVAFRNLRVVRIGSGTRISDSFAVALAQHCTRLEVLQVLMPVDLSPPVMLQLAQACPGLKALRFSCNSFGSGSMLIHFSALACLRSLHLLCNSSRPDALKSIGALTGLAHLRLKITAQRIPDSIWGIRKLKLLHIEAQAEGLSPLLGLQSHLTCLRLVMPHLRSIPRDVGDHVRIRRLFLALSSITVIPGFLSRLKNLRHVEIVGPAVRVVEVDVTAWTQLRRLSLKCPRVKEASKIALGAQRSATLSLKLGVEALAEVFPDSPPLAAGFAEQGEGPASDPNVELKPSAVTLGSGAAADRDSDRDRGLLLLALPAAPSAAPPAAPATADELVSLVALSARSVATEDWLPRHTVFRSLRKLKVESSDVITSLPESLGSLTRLSSLTLKLLNSLQSLPDSIGCLTQLKVFKIWRCDSLALVPPSMGNLTSLQVVSWTRIPKLSFLPTTMGALKCLRELTLHMLAKVQSLPPEMSGLASLDVLSISSNSALREVPPVLGWMVPLRSLDIDGLWNVTQFGVSLARLTALEELRVGSFPKLVLLPESLGVLPRLLSLKIHDCCSLTHLPTSLGQLTMLRELELVSLMSLVKLPQSIGDLRSLRCLKIENLKVLTSLPDSVTRLTELRVLDVHMCKHLYQVPRLTATLRNLTEQSVALARELEGEAKPKGKDAKAAKAKKPKGKQSKANGSRAEEPEKRDSPVREERGSRRQQISSPQGDIRTGPVTRRRRRELQEEGS